MLKAGYSTSCSTNDVGIDWTASASNSDSLSSDLSYQSTGVSTDCDEDVCAASEYDIDFALNVEDFLGFEWWDLEWSLSFSVDAAFCGDESVCDSLAGGKDSCHAIQFNFSQWYPTSCDATNDYDATAADFNITYKVKNCLICFANAYALLFVLLIIVFSMVAAQQMIAMIILILALVSIILILEIM